MGGLCSKSNKNIADGGHQVLGSAAGSTTSASNPASPDERRKAAAEAAERRQKAANGRGTHVSNPNQGRLAAQLEASKKAKLAPEPREEERLVWD